MTETKDEIEKARFLFETALKSDEVLTKASEKLNDKTKGFLSITAGLIPIIIGVGYYILNQITSYWIFVITFSLFLLCLLCLGGAIALGIYAQKPQAYRMFNPLIMMKKYNQKDQIYLINKYAATWSDTVNRNLKKLNTKQYYLRWMLRLICLAMVFLILVFFFLGISLTPV